MNRLCLVPELEPKQEAATTNIYHLLDFLQPLTQIRLNRANVSEHLVEMKVHRLFVVDKGGVLVGVISPLDVLRSML